MDEPCIRVRNLTKQFRNRKVVDDLSFDVKRGEVFALLGHNGAGKSTTIDLILGLKAPDGGSARILGMDAAKNRKQVFERVGVPKSMNVATSLLYFPMLLFSGATIPAEVFPAGLQNAAKLMPLGVGINLLKSVSMGCYDRMGVPVIILIAIAVICSTVAVRTFRWE